MSEDVEHPVRSVAVLCYAMLSYALAQTMLLPALPHLIRGLHTNENDVGWLLTAYFLSAAVFTPIAGRLGDMFGKRRVIVIATVTFGAGAIVAAMSSSLWPAVAGRALQGMGGAIFPLCYGIARDLLPPRQVARTIGLLAATAGIGGALAFVIGGVVADHASYHWIFWLSAIMGLSGGLGIQFLVPESTSRTGGRVDIRGAIVLAVGLTLPLLAIAKATTWGWTSGRTLGLAAAGLAVLAAWVRLQLRTEQPMANIASLRSPPVLMTNLAGLLGGFGMLAVFVLIPQLAQAARSTGYGFGLDATGAGLLLLPGGVAMVVLGTVSGALGTRVGNKVPLALGGVLTTIALALLAVDHGSEGKVLAFAVLMCTGIGLAFAALPNLIIDSVEQTETSSATGFNVVITRIGMSIGAQVSASILAGSALTSGGKPTDRGYTIAFLAASGVALAGALAALAIPRPRRRARPLRLEGAPDGS